jgi:uncharacterized membrane protein
MLSKKQLLYRTAGIAVLTLIAILLPWQDFIVIKILRIVFGSIFILFLPGYRLTLSFFTGKEIDWLERFALSFALSISVVPLLTFYVNLIGVKITQLNVFLIVVLVIAINILWIEKDFIRKTII